MVSAGKIDKFQAMPAGKHRSAPIQRLDKSSAVSSFFRASTLKEVPIAPEVDRLPDYSVSETKVLSAILILEPYIGIIPSGSHVVMNIGYLFSVSCDVIGPGCVAVALHNPGS
jgi:hypothetical protein